MNENDIDKKSVFSGAPKWAKGVIGVFAGLTLTIPFYLAVSPDIKEYLSIRRAETIVTADNKNVVASYETILAIVRNINDHSEQLGALKKQVGELQKEVSVLQTDLGTCQERLTKCVTK